MKGVQGIGLARTSAVVLVAAATTLTLGGCLSGGESESAWVGDIENEVTVSGSVGDGPAIDASVRIRSKSGDEIAVFKSDSKGSYSIDIKVGDGDFPLLIDASGGTDIVTNEALDFVMRSAVLSSRDNVTANVNPFSTFAYETASDMNGGLTRDNLVAAEDIVVSSMNSGLTSVAGQGPMQTPVEAGNVAEFIKASETLAEIVRRTRDALNSAGRGTNGETVIQALGSDLIDTVIEGNGGPRADARTAAVTIVASAQVLLESMSNQLHVNGVNATDDMRRAIGQVMPGAADSALDQLSVTRDMIRQANIGLSAAYAVTGDARIFDLIRTLGGVRPGMEATLVRTLLPGDYRGILGAAIDLAANGDSSVVSAINEIARNGDVPDNEENRAPAISGQPPGSVRAGSPYEFAPTASDLDGDPLTFNIAGRPAWASFDSMTGRLSGTPQAGDAGSYDGITISVSDGELTSSVGPFSIVVTTANTAPSIDGTPATVVGVGEEYAFTPEASDPDGDTLRFSISGMPSWASFDGSSGTLSGSPEAGDAGVFDNIVISVSDGNASASLAPFSVEVMASGAATGSVTLSWTPPTENDDGSQLMDLAGYRIYWSRDGGAFDNSAQIDNPGVTSYVVDSLTPGSYEFVATSINSAGIESRFSNAVTQVVQ